MRMPSLRAAAFTTLLLMPAFLSAQKQVDLATIERIKTEATERSQVMAIMSWLTDVHGPRLTGSPITRAAGDWAAESLREWGVANVRLEAMRILTALDLKPRRTIMIGLWTGEEQGLLGSRAFVAQHLATRGADGVTPKPMHEKFSAYFNVDNGGGKIRGVFQQSNPAMAPIFEAWMEPFKEGGMKTLTITNTGGTDHLAFDAVGIPGFQFIQDPIEYGTRTHHTNMDVYERIQPEDMKWNSAVPAAFAWQAAERDDKLPRKPMPAPPAARP